MPAGTIPFAKIYGAAYRIYGTAYRIYIAVYRKGQSPLPGCAALPAAAFATPSDPGPFAAMLKYCHVLLF